ncbi:hypothetical protein EII29_02845 [Leptotrichia sp. OH3620_COT-345]|uniref:hypothetical protein n=1 Tax=Leptotrichia sp. OH3620_COT-345 TaxID=2491048 RepID=UPI000F649BEB|nr:hypothetical protein [Leptotrichia sp. OH3620_COT-345]RRD40432.1 hypothetical protein EII29_02845 [Leptotrichia sp. OH3620_COT-345]
MGCKEKTVLMNKIKKIIIEEYGGLLYMVYFAIFVDTLFKFLTFKNYLDKMKTMFWLYIIFFGIYGLFGKMSLKKCLIRGIISTFITLLVFTITRGLL